MDVFIFLYFLFYAFRIATPSGWLLQTVCNTISLFNCVSVIAVTYLAVNLNITCFFFYLQVKSARWLVVLRDSETE